MKLLPRHIIEEKLGPGTAPQLPTERTYHLGDKVFGHTVFYDYLNTSLDIYHGHVEATTISLFKIIDQNHRDTNGLVAPLSLYLK